jgi:predicted secreted protein
VLRIFFLYILVTIAINLSFDSKPSLQVALTFTAADQLREVELTSMDTFQIQLPVQMGSGYQWAFSATDHPGVRLLSQKMKDVKPLPGGKQHQVFTFQARQSGFTPVRLTCKRPWEEAIEDEFKMFFNVSSSYAQQLP